MTTTNDTLIEIAEEVLRKIANDDVDLIPRVMDAFADALDARKATLSQAEYKALDEKARTWAAKLARIDNEVVSEFVHQQQ